MQTRDVLWLSVWVCVTLGTSTMILPSSPSWLNKTFWESYCTVVSDHTLGRKKVRNKCVWRKTSVREWRVFVGISYDISDVLISSSVFNPLFLLRILDLLDIPTRWKTLLLCTERRSESYYAVPPSSPRSSRSRPVPWFSQASRTCTRTWWSGGGIKLFAQNRFPERFSRTVFQNLFPEPFPEHFREPVLQTDLLENSTSARFTPTSTHRFPIPV